MKIQDCKKIVIPSGDSLFINPGKTIAVGSCIVKDAQELYDLALALRRVAKEMGGKPSTEADTDDNATTKSE